MPLSFTFINAHILVLMPFFSFTFIKNNNFDFINELFEMLSQKVKLIYHGYLFVVTYLVTNVQRSNKRYELMACKIFS